LTGRLSNTIRKALRLRREMSFGFYATDFLFRKVLRQNAGVPWAIHHTSTIHCAAKIVRGTGVFPGDSPGVYINATNGIHIGDYTNIGPDVGLLSANHNFVDNSQYDPAEPIKIGKHCWIGKGASILPGIQLGDFTIVGAGAVVTHSFNEGYCVIAGNPARKIKELNPKDCIGFADGKQKL
jgi:acetyltransferase-like isoleucine patch superfamily enzyme